jgi:hypothetical protein
MSRDKSKDAEGEYTVGYGRPPQHTRFQKGQSGNPRGRPRQPPPPTERAKEMLIAEAYRPVSVREGDVVRRMPALQALMRNLINTGAKGDHRAQKVVMQMIQAIEQENDARLTRLAEAAISYKRGASEEIEERKRMVTYRAEDYSPHPDDVLIEMQTGRVALRELPFGQDARLLRLEERLDQARPRRPKTPR